MLSSRIAQLNDIALSGERKRVRCNEGLGRMLGGRTTTIPYCCEHHRRKDVLDQGSSKGAYQNWSSGENHKEARER
jgi:hypothetical protein